MALMLSQTSVTASTSALSESPDTHRALILLRFLSPASQPTENFKSLGTLSLPAKNLACSSDHVTTNRNALRITIHDPNVKCLV